MKLMGYVHTAFHHTCTYINSCDSGSQNPLLDYGEDVCIDM